MENQKINCSVKDCIHNDASKCACTLKSITVDNIYAEDVTSEKDDTICDSFECRDKDIYEADDLEESDGEDF